MTIGQVVGTVIQDGVLMYQIFNGYHHGQPVYWYTPKPIDRDRSMKRRSFLSLLGTIPFIKPVELLLPKTVEAIMVPATPVDFICIVNEKGYVIGIRGDMFVDGTITGEISNFSVTADNFRIK